MLQLLSWRLLGMAQVQDYVFSCPGSPCAQDARKQFIAAFEMVVEATSGNFHLLSQGINPDRINAATHEYMLSGFDPIFPGEVGTYIHVFKKPCPLKTASDS